MAAAALVHAAPALADPVPGPDPAQPSVFDGNWLTVGVGATYGPSYDGSDDYVLSPIPAIAGKVDGISINPRANGVALDFIPDTKAKVNFALGPSFALRSDRASRIVDPVVERAGKLKRAIEVGGAAGVSFSGLLDPYDSLSFDLDARWDVNGAYGGMVLAPSVSYFTPLSRGIAADVTLSAERGDNRFANYYYSVSPAQSLASGLPQYRAHGGWTKAGAGVLMAFDFDGNLANGGFAAVVGASYSRMLGDAARSPYTSIRGSRNQWVVGAGLGYTF